MRQLIYYCAPVGGLATYLTLLHLLGSTITKPLAWINSLVAVVSLCTTAVMYLPTAKRTEFLSQWGYILPAMIFAGGLLLAVLGNVGHFAATPLIASILCLLTLLAIRSDDERRTLVSSILSAILLPLSAVASLLAFPFAWGAYTAALLIVIALACHFQPKKTTQAVPARIEDGTDALVNLGPLAASLLAQLPLILFPLLEPVVISLAASEDVTQYMMLWKIIYGVIVVVYTRIQFRLAFHQIEYSRLRLHKLLALVSFVAVWGLSIFEASYVQPIRILLASVFINEAAILVRSHLRTRPSLLAAMLAASLFFTCIGVAYAQPITRLVTHYEIDVLAWYPAMISTVAAMALISLFGRTNKTESMAVK